MIFVWKETKKTAMAIYTISADSECRNIATKLQIKCHKIAQKLPQNCTKIAIKLQKNCNKIAEKLPQNCRKIATKLQKSWIHMEERTADTLAGNVPMFFLHANCSFFATWRQLFLLLCNSNKWPLKELIECQRLYLQINRHFRETPYKTPVLLIITIFLWLSEKNPPIKKVPFIEMFYYYSLLLSCH